MDNFSERAYRILELLAADPNLTQRALAQRSGMSHGLANIILRRCIRIGMVKAKNVDGRRLRYFVTPKGVQHVMKRSLGYVQRTLESYRTLRGGIEALVDRLRSEGKTHFVVVGEGDVPEIVRNVVVSRPGLSHDMRSDLPVNGRRTTDDGPTAVLDCRWKGGDIGVSVLHEVLFRGRP